MKNQHTHICLYNMISMYTIYCYWEFNAKIRIDVTDSISFAL